MFDYAPRVRLRRHTSLSLLSLDAPPTPSFDRHHKHFSISEPDHCKPERYWHPSVELVHMSIVRVLALVNVGCALRGFADAVARGPS